ncbi:MAG: hypothetical protein LBM74_04470 [Oscillospiraceae bacterium]|jgi:bifunctional UDP-N-acetylglucosamine pyrophosphorylase/glucosamine-1-phosphate N-acetyltransferase|nr:hypothetical protein [Oscillospiraceae bacterium]
MKHTALLITAGEATGARIGASFLLPAMRHEAAKCCDSVREIREEEITEALLSIGMDGCALLLDAAMPLLEESDLRALLAPIDAGAAEVLTKGLYPRAIAPAGYGVETVTLREAAQTLVQTPADLAAALATLHARKAASLLAQGVLLLDPAHTYIDPQVLIGAGTVIHPNNTLSGATVIGENCVLLPGNRMQDARLGDGVTVEQSVLLSCEVAKGTTVGPFAYLRPNTAIGEGCRIGDFVEIKNSRIGNGTKVSHLTYVGDSDLGERINLGCGVVFVNYDGKRKHRTRIGDDAFIGCNVNLVSPVQVGDGAYVAAGSTITEDVPGDAMAVARARQVVKPGWVAKRKQEGKL